MALSKLAITLIASSIGVVAIGATATGIVLSRQNSEQSIDTNKEETTSKPTNSNDSLPNDLPQENRPVDLKVELEKVIAEINENDILIHPLKASGGNEVETNMNLERSKVYAFNIKPIQLNYKKESELKEKKLNLSLEIDQSSNTIQTLNEGELNIKLKIQKADDSSNTIVEQNKKLTDFKKASETLYNLFQSEKETNRVEEDYILTITPKTAGEDQFVSIEDLNENSHSVMQQKPSGLTKWLTKSSINVDGEIKNLYLTGEIQLQKISKTQNKTEFLLKPKENTFIKLMGKKQEQDKEFEEILVSGIKTNNLLASWLIIKPKIVNKEKTEAFIKALKGLDSSDDKYTVDKEELLFKLSDSNPININVHAFGIEDLKNPDPDTIQLDVTIGFGAKKYQTNNESDLTELKEAGFNFQIFSKKLKDHSTVVKPSILKMEDTKKLGEYFKQDNYKKPTSKSAKNSGEKEEANKGSYLVTKVDLEKINELKISVKNSGVDVEETDANNPINLIIFGNYSYEGIDNSNVLYTPNLSLIQIAKKTN